jgi:hypothetical protein
MACPRMSASSPESAQERSMLRDAAPAAVLAGVCPARWKESRKQKRWTCLFRVIVLQADLLLSSLDVLFVVLAREFANCGLRKRPVGFVGIYG